MGWIQRQLRKLGVHLPRREMHFTSPYSVQDAIERLNEVTKVPSYLRLLPPRDMEFLGVVGPACFSVNRHVLRVSGGMVQRNSFAPDTLGVVYPAATGSSVHLRMSMADSILVFLSLWSVMWLGLIVEAGSHFIEAPSPTGAIMLAVLAGIVASPWFVARIAFDSGVNSMVSALSETMNLTPLPPDTPVPSDAFETMWQRR